MKKAYVQFSKRIVVAVTACVTLVSGAGIVLTYLAGELTEATEIVKAYISYATIVFAAYSGNSAVQKWLVKKYSADTTTENNDNNDSDNG